MRTKLIGIAGRAGAGKDTLAAHLHQQHRFIRTAFAEPLKVAAASVFGLRKYQFDDHDYKDVAIDGVTPRQRIIQLADTLKAEFGEDLFVNTWKASIARNRMFGEPVLVSDVRLACEVDAVKALGGIIIYIVRPDVADCSGAGHISEQFDPAWADHLLHNDTTPAGLYARFDTLAATI